MTPTPTRMLQRRPLRAPFVFLRNKLTIWWIRFTTIETTVRRSCGHYDAVRVKRRHAAWRIKTYEWSQCPECHFREIMADEAAKRWGMAIKPDQRKRGQFEQKYRNGEGAPKFYCCHCNEHGKTLRHIGSCGRKKAKQ